MSEFGLLLRSYDGDFHLAQRLVESFRQHNPNDLQLVCCVSEPDVGTFSQLQADNVTVMSDRELSRHFVDDEVAGIRPGYINQEIVKLAFHELGIFENYFCIDSDAIFIRDIRREDFIAPDGFPYTVLVEDNELKTEPTYFSTYWEPRERAIREIARVLDYRMPILRTCHGHQVMSSQVLRSFVSDFLIPRKWSYSDVLAIAPYEFSWYNLWLQKTEEIPIHSREPLVKVYHHARQHQEHILRGVSESDLARGYLAVVVNSNFSRDLDMVDLNQPKPVALAPHLSFAEVAQLLMHKLKNGTLRLTSGST